MSRFGTFKLGGVEYDMERLTLNEMEIVEGIAGAVFAEMNFGSATSLKAIGYVLMKRTNPELTIEEAGESLTIGDFLPPEEEMPETGPPAEGEAGTVDLNGSGLADAGVLDSAVSTPG